jgi:hypothetical protein
MLPVFHFNQSDTQINLSTPTDPSAIRSVVEPSLITRYSKSRNVCASTESTAGVTGAWRRGVCGRVPAHRDAVPRSAGRQCDLAVDGPGGLTGTGPIVSW